MSSNNDGEIIIGNVLRDFAQRLNLVVSSTANPPGEDPYILLGRAMSYVLQADRERRGHITRNGRRVKRAR